MSVSVPDLIPAVVLLPLAILWRHMFRLWRARRTRRDSLACVTAVTVLVFAQVIAGFLTTNPYIGWWFVVPELLIGFGYLALVWRANRGQLSPPRHARRHRFSLRSRRASSGTAEQPPTPPAT